MENLFYQPGINQGTYYLSPEESKHCIRVLRKKNGDSIILTDGSGNFYNALITDDNANQCQFTVQDTWQEPTKKFSIHLAISPTKNPDRIEWMVEKCVELGIDKITFLNCKNTERQTLKYERMVKISLSAMKQSFRATAPIISPIIPFQEFMNITPLTDTESFIAFVDTANPNHLLSAAKPGRHYCVLVGPEGDFTPDELTIALAKGYKKVSLGNCRLRTETAGLAACHILNLVNT